MVAAQCWYIGSLIARLALNEVTGALFCRCKHTNTRTSRLDTQEPALIDELIVDLAMTVDVITSGNHCTRNRTRRSSKWSCIASRHGTRKTTLSMKTTTVIITQPSKAVNTSSYSSSEPIYSIAAFSHSRSHGYLDKSDESKQRSHCAGHSRCFCSLEGSVLPIRIQQQRWQRRQNQYKRCLDTPCILMREAFDIDQCR